MESKFCFKDYKFKKIAFAMNENFSPESGEGVQVDYRFSVETHLVIPEGAENITPETKVKESKVEVTAEVFKNREKKTPENHIPFCLEVVIVGYFEMAEAVSCEDMDRFSKCNAVATLFPYIRMMVSTITAGANFTPLLMPLINVQALQEAQKWQE